MEGTREDIDFLHNGRLLIIMEKLKKSGRVNVLDLAQELVVSTATIRRDLSELEKQGMIRRTHGGAVLENVSTTFEYQYRDKLTFHMEEKQRIALQAVREIQDGDSIFLDSGTTTYQIALRLAEKKNLTIITYDMSIAVALNSHPSAQVIVTGGVVRSGYNVLLGSITEKFIQNMMVDEVFLSADGVDPAFGISNANYMEAGEKSLLMEAGKRKILVADRSKFGKVTVSKITDLNRLDLIITDRDLSVSVAEAIRQKGVEVKCV